MSPTDDFNTSFYDLFCVESDTYRAQWVEGIIHYSSKRPCSFVRREQSVYSDTLFQRSEGMAVFQIMNEGTFYTEIETLL